MSSLLSRPLPPRVSGAVIALSLGVVLFKAADRPEEPARILSAHASAVPTSLHSMGKKEIPDLSVERPELGDSKADPFAIPAPPPEETKAAAPSAPPLPFAYLGKVVDGGRTTVFVARGDENHAIEAGQTVAGQYRVDRITDKAVTFTYLPLKQRQTLAIKGE